MKKYLPVIFCIALVVLGYLLIPVLAPKKLNQSAVPTPKMTADPIQEEIVQALSEKNSWDREKLVVNVAEADGNYARGDVKLKDEMGGGLWFAVKKNTWEIVYDGNGIMPCERIKEYPDFPQKWVPRCFNGETEGLEER